VVATVCGLFGGPAMYWVSRAFANGSGGLDRAIAVVGFFVAVACFAALWAGGAGIWRWDRAESLRRGAVVFAVGGVLWVLPASWSVPDSILAYPFDWLLLTVPYVVAAVAVSPGSTRRLRILAVAPLAAVAVLWPTFCGMAADEVRHRSGVPADGWFAVHVAGYAPYPESSLRDGALVIDYDGPGSDAHSDSGGGMWTESWPATTASPCDHFEGVGSYAVGAECTAEGNGTWSVTDHEGLVGIVARRGTWYLAVEAETYSDAVFAPSRLPAILAAAHVADDHEVLEIADRS
jgi:hypothetical protein